MLKPTWKQWVLAALGATVVGLALRFFSRSPAEPAYAGKSLSDWLDQLAPAARSGPFSWTQNQTLATAQVGQAEAAIHSMGTQVVPFLLNRVRGAYSLRERLYSAVWQKIPGKFQAGLAPPRQFRTYGNPPSQIVWALQALDCNAVPALVEALRDKNSGVQITALAALAGFGTNAVGAIPSLFPLAKDKNGFVRRWAILALGKMGPKCTNGLPTLMAALQDNEISPLPGSSARVRETAAAVLGEIGPPARAALPQLRKLLTDLDRGVRQEAAIALWRIEGERDILPTLIDELKKSDDPRKILAVLGEMGPMAKSALPAMRDALGPSWNRIHRPWVSLGSTPALGRGLEGPTLEEVARKAVYEIDPATTDEAPDASFISVTPLALGGSGSSVIYVGYAGRREGGAARAVDAEAEAEAWVQVLRDPNPDQRLAAMLALNEIAWQPGPKIIPTLLRLLNERSAFRYRGWQDKEQGPEFVCTGDLAAEMLGRIGPEARLAIIPLKQLLADPNWEDHPEAPLAIWRIEHDTNILETVAQNLQHARSADKFRRFLAIAAEMGPAAKPATSAILSGRTNFTNDFSGLVRSALERIDPDAAASLGSLRN